jgi:8-amino-7-oxononanoate synthase
MTLQNYMEHELQELSLKQLDRHLGHNNPHWVGFSSNDYLNLTQHPDSLEAGYQAAKHYGTGSTGSRLLSGNKAIFESFEQQIATDKHSESALIFNSGFIANSSLISVLSIPEKTLFIFDQLNHASMYYGMDLRKVKLLRYPHLDYSALEDILKRYTTYEHRIIVSETVFGMDGDMADIGILSSLSQQYGATLILDEAHATGLYGENGYGLSTNYELDPSSSIIMGTFSKALASSGAYIACSRLIRDFLIQKSKGFIYSTALPPFCMGVAAHNWNLLKNMAETRYALLKSAEDFRDKVCQLGYRTIGSGTNIIPIIFDSIDKMLHQYEIFLKNEIMISAIRPPTSPTPRLRLALNAGHTEEHLSHALKILSP